MRFKIILILSVFIFTSIFGQHNSLTIQNSKTIKSNYSFQDTQKNLIDAISNNGMTIFTTIDHREAAEKKNLTMQPSVVIIFGNPKVGTPLMKKDPLFALQLPLKVLVTEVDDEVLVSFISTLSLIKYSYITYHEVENTLGKVEKLIEKTVK